MVEIVKLNESYIRVFCDLDIAIELSNYFSFYTKNYKWSPKWRSGVWDGKIRLFNIKSGMLPIGLYDDLLGFLTRKGIEYKINATFDGGLNLSEKYILKFNKEVLKCDFTPRDYQVKSVQYALKNKKCILLSSTGSGKSYIIFLIFNLLKFFYEDCKFLLCVPTMSLTSQMTEDFIEYGKNFCDYNDYIHQIYAGQSKDSEKPIIISTWQSLMGKGKNGVKKSWFDNFSCVLVDETHTATASQLSNIVNKCENAVYKIGTTGSLTDNETDKMQLKSLFSDVYSASNTKNLQKKKILSQLKIRNCVLDYPSEYRNLCKKMDYPSEMNFIRESEERKKFIFKLVNRLKGNTLVLFRSIEYGKALFEMFDHENKFLVYGKTKTIDRELSRKNAEKSSNVLIIASFAVFSQGINIKNLPNLVFGESMKSSIKVIQSIGRILRLHEDKKYATLYDICDDISYKKHKNYVLKHFFERIKIYDKQGFNYSTKTFKI